MNRNGISAGTLVYLLVGMIIVANRGYLSAGVHTLASLISVLLEIILWPLLLLGVNLTVNF